MFAIDLPWPPANRTILEQHHDGRSIRLSQRSDAALYADMFDITVTPHRLLSSVVTTPIIAPDPVTFGLGVVWEEGSDQIHSVMADGKLIYSSDASADVLSELVLKKKVEADGLPQRVDFAERNKAAQRERKRLLEQFRSNPQRTFGGPDYAFNALQAELSQVRDLTRLVEIGQTHHIPGLMSRIRSLVIGRRPLGLLQLCAAFIDAPLTIFTMRNPELGPPEKVKMWVSLGSAQGDPDGYFKNPIDFDVWATIPALWRDGEPVRHWEMIKEIGDTAASHWDIDIPRNLAAFRTGFHLSDVPVDHVGKYALVLSEIVLCLGEGLIEARQSGRSRPT